MTTLTSSPNILTNPQPDLVNTEKARIQSVDILRGLVMVIMAIDHVRVYSGIPAGGLTYGIFFTRWITHYCAPAFAFFAGTSAFLYYQKSGNRKDLVQFLVTRGLLLVVFELTLVRFFWTFNFQYSNFTITGVIWMLGWCMVLLAPIVRLRPSTLAIIGVAMIAFQQVLGFLPLLFPESLQPLVVKYWSFFYPSAVAGREGVVLGAGSGGLPSALGVSIFYVILPWLGVMMAGYGFGQLLLKDPATVKRLCLRIGLSATALFLVVAAIFAVRMGQEGNDSPFIFRVLGQQKYPPSQLYILMTLGPVIALIPWAQKIKGRIADALKTIGRVPMFYYLLHLLLIHLSAYVVNLALYGTTHQDWYETAPFVGFAEEFRWSLPLLYLTWAIDVVLLYFACVWYARYKGSHPEIKWMKYL